MRGHDTIGSEEGKAFVHANCVFAITIQVNESGSRVLYLVLFDTSFEIKSL
jgi:hypothetical protein